MKRNQRNVDTDSRGVRKSRRDKIADSDCENFKDKFLSERKSQQPLVAKTEKQKKYLSYLNDPDIQLIVCTGIFGCGKSYLSACVAADRYRNKNISKIIVVRPYVQTGKSSGSKPGTSLQKLYPYVRNVLDPIRQRLGKSVFEIALDDGERGSIEVQELESIRGRSFDEKSFLIIEEAQQSTPEEMLAIVTRVSDNCKIVVSGDLNQRDIKGDSGLKWLLDFVKRHKIKGVATIDFNSTGDIVRGGLVREIAIGLVQDGRY